jgi:Fe-S cluster biosynthesis and repair protein YggX
MTERIITCAKLGKKLPGLSSPPFKNDLGKKIYDHISKEAWQLWLSQQTMLINEYRLNLIEQSTKEFLQAELKKFLFEGHSALPPDYIAPKDK